MCFYLVIPTFLSTILQNFSKPSGTQSLRLRKDLGAMPRGPSLPPRGLAQDFHEAFAIRASRLEKFCNLVFNKAGIARGFCHLILL